MGATQGLLAALVVGTAPARLGGTAFGFYSLIRGGAAGRERRFGADRHSLARLSENEARHAHPMI
jgi:hypothetical protein